MKKGVRNNIIDNFLNEIMPEEQVKIDKRIEEFIQYQDELKRLGKKYNTDTSVSLDHLREHGLNPIAITQLYLEETFVFNTPEEADKGYELLEKELSLVSGWWYDKEKFTEVYDAYCVEMDYSPKIYYLDGKP